MSLFSQLIPLRTNRLVRRSENAAEDTSYVVPPYDLKESKDAYGLEIFVPGVTRDAVEIDIDQGQLVITASRRWKAPDTWAEIFRESADADYRLRLDLNDVVQIDKINAELEHGVLKVTLPKAEAIKPRKIDVN